MKVRDTDSNRLARRDPREHVALGRERRAWRRLVEAHGHGPRPSPRLPRLPGPGLADRDGEPVDARLDNGHLPRRGGRVEGECQHVAASELLAHATVVAAPRHAQDLLAEELRVRRRGSEQRDASFLESSLRPRRALPSELGSRRAVLLEHERVPALRVVVRSAQFRLVTGGLPPMRLERVGDAEKQCCLQCSCHLSIVSESTRFGEPHLVKKLHSTAAFGCFAAICFLAGDAATVVLREVVPKQAPVASDSKALAKVA